MQCADFEPRLQDLLDADPAPPFDRVLADSLLAGHTANCAACRQVLAAVLTVVRETAALPAPAGSPSLSSRVLAQLQPAPRRRVWPLRLALPLAAAATLAVALPMWAWLGGSTMSPAKAPAAKQLAHAAHAPAIAAAQAPQPTPWSLVPGMADFSFGPNRELDAGLDGWGNDVREGLAPVTHSTAGTLQLLWQAISPPEDNRS